MADFIIFNECPFIRTVFLLAKEISALSAETMSPEQIERLSVYLNQWEEIDFEDRRQVADGLISQIRATDEHVSIEWKI